MTTKTEPKSREPRAKSQEPERVASRSDASTSEQIVAIPLDKLRDHPGNPESTEAEILEMMQWLADGEQDEPITVRPLPDPIGHYEVLAGKRRLAAARRLGWDSLQARIRRDLVDDRDAAAFAARNNLERRTENDLRKAHWLRYQVDQLGMTVDAAASAMGIAQSTASNLMAVGELCEQHGYWRDLLIAGEMTSAHLRPIKKYRGYPVVMKMLIESHQALAKSAVKQDWRRAELIECWGTRDAIENTIVAVIESETRALATDDMLAGEVQWNLPNFDASMLTHEQRKSLQIIALPEPGDKSERLVSRCRNLKVWQSLRKAASADAKKKAADRSSRGGKAKQTSAVDRGKQLADRIRYWRHAWLRQMVAERLDKHPLIVARLRAWLQTDPFSGIVPGELDLAKITIAETGGKSPGYRSHEATWDAVRSLSEQDVERISLALLRSILLHEDRKKKWPRLKWEMVDDLAQMAGIDVAAEWSAMQQSSTRPVQFETFFLLHDIGQLTTLAGELKVGIEGATSKKQLVARLTGQPRRLPLPAAIATVKPAGKKKK